MAIKPTDLGWSDFFADAFAAHAEAGLDPARVTVVNRGGYVAHLPDGELPAEVSGRFRHESRGPEDFPAVGDWVAVRRRPGETRVIIHAVLPRKTRFSRTGAGRSGEQQILAANVDAVFLLSSLNQEFNPRRLERYLTLARDSGAQPVVVLTKADLCDDPGPFIRDTEAVASGAPVLAVSCRTGKGVKALVKQLPPGHTAVLLGSSGVGKSTLINRLMGDEWQDVLPVRETDDKGRHTTTRRELFILPSGGLLIDTPGLRELQLWDGAEGLEETFADVEAIATGCRFTDCAHESEPGCAVRAAAAAGQIDPARLTSFQKLQLEVKQFGRRHLTRAASETRVGTKSFRKQPPPSGPPR